MKSPIAGGLVLAALLVTLFSPSLSAEIPNADGRNRPAATPTPYGVKLVGRAAREGYPDWDFEILMFGHGHYYRKEWHGREDAESGWLSVWMATGDLTHYHRESWGDSGRRGRGGERWKEVARSLWAGPRLLRTSPGQPREGDERATEVFEGFTDRCGIRFPAVIRWTDRGRGAATVYRVQQITFLSRFDKGLFDAAKKRYFPEPK